MILPQQAVPIQRISDCSSIAEQAVGITPAANYWGECTPDKYMDWKSNPGSEKIANTAFPCKETKGYAKFEKLTSVDIDKVFGKPVPVPFEIRE